MQVRIKPLLIGFVATTLLLILVLVATVTSQLQEIREQYRHVQENISPLVSSLAEARFQVVQIQQFMTDASVTGDDEGIGDATKAKEACLSALSRAATLMPSLQEQTKTLQRSTERLHGMGIQMVQAYRTSQTAGNEIMKKADGFDVLAELTHQQVDELDKNIHAAEAENTTRLNQSIVRASWLAFVLSILTILIMLGAARLLYRTVFKLLGGEPAQATSLTAILAEGDLSSQIATHAASDSLIGLLAKMQMRWVEVVAQIIRNEQRLFSISHNVSESAHKLASNSKTQSDSSEAITVNIEELSVAIDNMAAATERIEEGGRSASSGEEMIGRVVQQIQEAAASVKNSAKEITTLDSKTAEISSIVSTIREIADQTNLLALNAAIEAARAGEAGRGFSVVADEVRKLAERTSTSTQNISALIGEIGNATHHVVRTIDEGVEQVETSVGYAQDALVTMNSIREDADQVRQELRQIHNALEETRSNAHDIARKVEQVSLMAHDNFDAANMLADTTEALDDLARTLDESTRFFRMPSGG